VVDPASCEEEPEIPPLPGDPIQDDPGNLFP